MPAASVALADAVVAALNAKTDWPQALTAVRKYLPRYKPEELTAARATAVPATVATTRAARGMWQQDWSVEVGLQKRVDPKQALEEAGGEREQCDALMELAESLVDFLRDLKVDGYQTLATELEPLWDPEQLETLEIFQAVVRVVFRSHA
jgi:hypothetical protein